ncbi:alpha/beta hydrolase family esterase [Kangiella koreensis]|uniref:Phospholipase/Carboxylesterase n=1 Tax=Kangiella koreensis (strain DSM 16069 / JCM 12317 / KCTC 12182 / SW-125) TaxID=523791 RepID=C7R7R6_KANKD|nr:PHB depolymerase family esterase [Kangiella koreensis]ACV27599.1 conserved hypothetical protein [Kangiella koreensis DSM 16069]
MKGLSLTLIFGISSSVINVNNYAKELSLEVSFSSEDAINKVIDLEVSGVRRQYQLYTPEGLSSPKALVFDFHGSGSNPQQQLAISNSQQIANHLQAVLVAPKAVRPFARGGFTWNTPYHKNFADDVIMSQTIIEQIRLRFKLSELPVVVTGFSGGARMASLLACKLPDKITAVALVAGMRQPELDGESCPDTGATHILSIHSIKDTINPYRFYDGAATSSYWNYGVEESLKAWAGRYQCETTPNHIELNDTVDVFSYQQCLNNKRIISYRLAEGGHTWPGSSFEFPDYLGSVNKSIDASKIISKFFVESLSDK